MWVLRGTVVAGRLFLFGCPVLPFGSSARFAARGRQLPAPWAPPPGAPTSDAPLGAATQLRHRGAPGCPLPARTGPRASQAPIRVAGEQRASVHPQLSRIIRMRRGALEACVRHV
ncbi:hypothetical protein NDU88_001624 [Pleurodeles waltl]|uniref:Secreted protein n=1 Tax=Pleurodeles waltl TaxID=8319 RepID=A0AAV7VA77_PLEWA|nr:hypothetical protein NDU88_001624 [Pleurodeles waltl]